MGSLIVRKVQKPIQQLLSNYQNSPKNDNNNDNHVFLNKHGQHTAGWKVYVQWYLSWKGNRRKGGQWLCGLQEEEKGSYLCAALRQRTWKGEKSKVATRKKGNKKLKFNNFNAIGQSTIYPLCISIWFGVVNSLCKGHWVWWANVRWFNCSHGCYSSCRLTLNRCSAKPASSHWEVWTWNNCQKMFFGVFLENGVYWAFWRLYKLYK